jgi:hypothetical protein
VATILVSVPNGGAAACAHGSLLIAGIDLANSWLLIPQGETGTDGGIGLRPSLSFANYEQPLVLPQFRHL